MGTINATGGSGRINTRPAQLSAQIPAKWRQPGIALGSTPYLQKVFNSADLVKFTKGTNNVFSTGAKMSKLLALPSVKTDVVKFAREVILKDTGLSFDIRGPALTTLLKAVDGSPSLVRALQTAFGQTRPNWDPGDVPDFPGGKGGGKAGSSASDGSGLVGGATWNPGPVPQFVASGKGSGKAGK